jgi:hypothetical protein
LKFKTVIFLFNVLMLCFIAAVFLAPLAALGTDLAGGFIRGIWFLFPLTLAVLGAVDLFFAANYRIYTLLEKEDWPALVQVLEEKVLRKGRRSGRLVKLLAAAYLVLSDPRSVTALEQKLAVSGKRLLRRDALLFGAARILAGDPGGAAAFFASLSGNVSGESGSKKSSEKSSGGGSEWIRWYGGFSLLLARRFEEASGAFILLAREGRDGVLAALSSYFLAESLPGFLPRRAGELRDAAAAGKDRVRRILRTRADWDREVRRVETEVHAAVLASYLNRAADYLYRDR